MKVKEEMLARAPKKLEEMARMDYMSQVFLYNSRLEFRYQSNMLDTRTTMGNKYKKKACPHCREGKEDGVEEFNPCPKVFEALFYGPLYFGKMPKRGGGSRPCQKILSPLKVFYIV